MISLFFLISWLLVWHAQGIVGLYTHTFLSHVQSNKIFFYLNSILGALSKAGIYLTIWDLMFNEF